MLLNEFRHAALGVAIAVTVFLSDSPAFAQHHGGSHHGGSSHSGGHPGGGHPGGGYSSGNHGGHYGGSHYGGNSRSGFSLSIGSGLGYGGLGYGGLGYGGLGYGGLGYSGLGYGAFGYPGPGYGYGGLGGVGYNNYGLSSYGLGLTSGLAIGRFDYANPYSSAYRGYGSGYSPYYSSGYGSNVDVDIYASPSAGYVPTDSYTPGYRYDGAASEAYGVPGYNSEFSHRPSANDNEGRYSSGRFDETYPDAASSRGTATGELRPGMILPDGSRVISVGPAVASPSSTPEKVDAPAEDAAPKRGEL